ncbi:MAG: protein kinase [Chloroflexota bacterium]|nr:protein kinase [Chloroflexota bacterium]
MQTQQVDQLIGQIVGGYRVEQSLSRARLSAVYLARQPLQNQPVALTTFIIPEQFSVRARNRFIARFNQEATALTALNHPHLLPIYSYGEHLGYPYLVTPYVTEGSLANVLKRQGRCTPAYTLEVLEQVAEVLDYVHGKGVVHRALKPSNILLRGDEHNLQVAGFGLVRILELRDVGKSDHPYAHLLSLAGTFLGAPEYLAPEAVQGQQLDARADIYALGIMIFELLTGKPPFNGSDPLAVAQQHVQQPLPALQQLCPAAPAAIEQVLAQALARDPARRFQRAGDFAAAYGLAVRGRKKAPATQVARTQDFDVAPYADLDDDALATSPEAWQLKPPIVTSRLPAVPVTPAARMPAPGATRYLANDDGAQDTWQYQPFQAAAVTGGRFEAARPTSQLPRETDELASAPRSSAPKASALPPVMADDPDLDSFAWWSGAAPMRNRGERPEAVPARVAEPLENRETKRPLVLPPMEQHSYAADVPQSRVMPPMHRRDNKKKRRQVVALLATGSIAVLATGTYVFAGKRVEHMLGDLLHPQMMAPQGNVPAQTNTGTGTGANPPKGKPAHGGTVVGSKNLAVNSYSDFTNPADGKDSLLIHLPNGKFAAYERACTHEGVTVNYDLNTHMLVCPAHGSIFNPADNGAVVQGPAARPIPHVAIHVNTDGTITTP